MCVCVCVCVCVHGMCARARPCVWVNCKTRISVVHVPSLVFFLNMIKGSDPSSFTHYDERRICLRHFRYSDKKWA